MKEGTKSGGSSEMKLNGIECLNTSLPIIVKRSKMKTKKGLRDCNLIMPAGKKSSSILLNLITVWLQQSSSSSSHEQAFSEKKAIDHSSLIGQNDTANENPPVKRKTKKANETKTILRIDTKLIKLITYVKGVKTQEW